MASGSPSDGEAGLTRREWEIVRLVAEGLSDQQIATQLFISPTTVHNHLMSAYQKLGVHSRLQLVLRYQRVTDGKN